MGMAVAVNPDGEIGIGTFELVGCGGIIGRIGKERDNPLQLGNWRLDALG